MHRWALCTVGLKNYLIKMQLDLDVSPPAKYHELKDDFEPSDLCP